MLLPLAIKQLYHSFLNHYNFKEELRLSGAPLFASKKDKTVRILWFPLRNSLRVAHDSDIMGRGGV